MMANILRLAAISALALAAACTGGQERNEDFDREVSADAGESGRAGVGSGTSRRDDRETSDRESNRDTREESDRDSGDDDGDVRDETGLLDDRGIAELEEHLDRVEERTGEDIEIEIVRTHGGGTPIGRATNQLMAGDASVLIYLAQQEGQIAIVRRQELDTALPVPLIQQIVDRFGEDSNRVPLAEALGTAIDSIAEQLQ